jgi:hypothetical protein
MAGDRAVMGASTAGDRGREVEDELTGGVGETEREASARARGMAPIDLAHGAARERERGWAGWHRQAGPPVGHRGQAGARARLGLVDHLGLNFVFYFPGNF